MEQRMTGASRFIFTVLIGFIFAMTIGCSKKPRVTGFLSDYSRLESEKGSLRYLDMKRLGTYSKFIVEPVKIRRYSRSQDLPDRATMNSLTNYMHDAIVNTIGDRYSIVSEAGPGVARLRIAITDIEESLPGLRVMPQTRISGEGLGGASMEAELLDSETREQIGALVESQKGGRFSLSSFSEWGDAKSVMDDWAIRFRNRLDEAHGY